MIHEDRQPSARPCGPDGGIEPPARPRSDRVIDLRWSEATATWGGTFACRTARDESASAAGRDQSGHSPAVFAELDERGSVLSCPDPPPCCSPGSECRARVTGHATTQSERSGARAGSDANGHVEVPSCGHSTRSSVRPGSKGALIQAGSRAGRERASPHGCSRSHRLAGPARGIS